MQMEKSVSRCSVIIDGRVIAESELRDHELDRARVALALFKRLLGSERITALLAAQCEHTELLMLRELAASRGRWVTSKTEVNVEGCSAEEFLKWFHERILAKDDDNILSSHPEHYVIIAADNGQTEVVETMGHFGLPTRIKVVLGIDPTEACPEPADIDPAYPIQAAGYSLFSDGTKGPRVLHQFVNTESGFRGKLAIYFPTETDPRQVEGHKWHLALEFKNWIENYFKYAGSEIRSDDASPRIDPDAH